jgi:hypothetical protein
MKKSAKVKPLKLPAGLTAKEKIKLWGGFIFGLLGLSLLFHFTCIQSQRASIRRTVEKWKVTYNIDEDRAARIRQIELEFHGSGSPFSLSQSQRGEAIKVHHQKIAGLMSAEDGERFLQAMEKSHGDH